MSQQYVDGEAVWTEKAKIYAEKSNGLKPVYTFSLPSALQEPVGGQEEKSLNVFLMEDRKGVGRLCGKRLSPLSLRSIIIGQQS